MQISSIRSSTASCHPVSAFIPYSNSCVKLQLFCNSILANAQTSENERRVWNGRQIALHFIHKHYDLVQDTLYTKTGENTGLRLKVLVSTIKIALQTARIDQTRLIQHFNRDDTVREEFVVTRYQKPEDWDIVYISPDQKILGEGAFGQVSRVLEVNTGCFWALKCATDPSEDSVLEEDEILSEIHLRAQTSKIPGLQQVPYQTYILSGLKGSLTPIMDHFMDAEIDGSSKRSFFDPKKTDVKKLFIELFTGLYAIHSAGFAHADIEPKNIALNVDTQEAMLWDLGQARLLIPDDQPYDPRYKIELSKRDVLDLARCLYQLLTGRLENELNQIDEDLLASYGVPSQFIEILRGCFEPDVNFRSSAKDVLDELKANIPEDSLESLGRHPSQDVAIPVDHDARQSRRVSKKCRRT